MGHYAKVVDSKVVQVIVAEPDFFNTFVDSSPGEWIQTSYNTRGNVHYLPNSQEPSGQPAVRGNYAGLGYTYDRANDVFHAPSPYASWVMDSATWTWKAPVEMPTEGGPYSWDETAQNWVASSLPA
jgi:hypothetical protein